MSGIVGIWNLDGRPLERAFLDAASATLAHRGPDGEGAWAEGAVGLACRLSRVTPEAATETQPFVHPSGTVLVFDGRLDNRDELLAGLPASPGVSVGSPDPALLLAAYDAFGDRFVERLTGDFALGLFDPAGRRLLLARDAIGIRPLYYHLAPRLFLFASEIKALLAHPQVSPRPNDDVLADYLLGGAQNSHGVTCFEGVFSLRPAHLAIRTTQGFVTRRYWDFAPCPGAAPRSFPECAEAFRGHFEQAVGRRLRSRYPVAVSVSGGLDSSSIFCLAESLGRGNPGRYPAILGVTYTSSDGSPSGEEAFLLDIERDRRVAIQRVPASPVGPLKGSREAVWHVESPCLDEQWDITHELHATVRRLGARVVLTGHWGDQILFPQAYLIDLLRSLAWGEILAHLREYGRWFTDTDSRCFRQQFFVDVVKYHVPPALLPLLRRLRASDRDRSWYTKAFRRRAPRQTVSGPGLPTAHARSLYEQARSSHHVRCMEWDNKVAAVHGLEMAFPFLDRDLISFLMGIPGEVQTWRGVPKGLLREAMRGVLPEEILCRNWKADFTHLVNAGMERDYPQLVRCLQASGTAVAMGYVRGDILGQKLARAGAQLRGRTCEIAWNLSDLLALEVWLQVFFGEHTNGGTGSPSTEGRPRPTMGGGTG